MSCCHCQNVKTKVSNVIHTRSINLVADDSFSLFHTCDGIFFDDNEYKNDKLTYQCFKACDVFPLTLFHFYTLWYPLYICSLYRGFSAEGTEKSVQCSELGGVHYIEVRLQQKLIGGTVASVQMRGVHWGRFYCNCNWKGSIKYAILTQTDSWLFVLVCPSYI